MREERSREKGRETPGARPQPVRRGVGLTEWKKGKKHQGKNVEENQVNLR